MRTFHSLSLCLLAMVAGILLGPVAHADTDGHFCQGGSAAAAANDDAESWQSADRYPEIDWTARIGSGRTAQPGYLSETLREDTYADARPARPPEAHWTSRIGTGTVANERPID